MNEFKSYYAPLIKGYLDHKRYPKQRIALVVGMWPWRNQVRNWILEPYHIQIQRHFGLKYFSIVLKPFIKSINPVVYIWGYKAPQFFIDYLRDNNVDIFFLEDGFIRSGPNEDSSAPPLSIVMDSQAPYFDTTRPNDLTDWLNNFDFKQAGYDERLVRESLDYFVSHRVSKYNHQPYVDVRPIYGIKDKKRVLVLGQVPNDDSLKYGGGKGITLIDVVTQAMADYPNAQIIVKPHPMTLNDDQTLYNLQDLKCLILDQPIHLVDALESVDHVYTITSLGGFEALLRGKQVTVLGQPFYKKWCHYQKACTSTASYEPCLYYLFYSLVAYQYLEL